MPDSALTVLLIGVGILAAGGASYLAFVGSRAIFRQSRQIAREAGCREGAARLRAVLRMIVWALFFGIYYIFLFLLGRSIGWWAVAPGLVGLACMVWGVLEADRLLTVHPEAVRQQLGIAATLTVLIAGFVSVIWWAAQAG
jgi:hypothetical protein